MGQQYEDEFDDFDEDDFDSDLPKKLRAQLKAKDKKLADLETKLAGFVEKERAVSLKQLVQDAGFSPKITAFMQNVDPTADAVQGWLQEYGDVFAGARNDSAVQEQQDGTSVDDAGVSAETLAALAAVGSVAPPVSSGGGGNAADDLKSSLEVFDGDTDELAAFIREKIPSIVG